MSIVVFTLSRQSSKMKQNELDYFLKKASTKTLLVKQNWIEVLCKKKCILSKVIINEFRMIFDFLKYTQKFEIVLFV